MNFTNVETPQNNSNSSSGFVNTQASQQPAQDNSSNKQKMPVTKIVIAFVIVALAGVAGTLGYLYWQESNDTSSKNQREAKSVQASVEKLVDTPKGEEPSVATVTDSKKLKENNPNFYADVENGMKLLVYSDRVILYDQKANKIVNLAIINTQNGDVAGTEDKDNTSGDNSEDDSTNDSAEK